MYSNVRVSIFSHGYFGAYFSNGPGKCMWDY